jgi:hypothetical protein
MSQLMVTSDPNACSKCGRRNPISFHVEPEEAWRTVMRRVARREVRTVARQDCDGLAILV